ncbi:hypothetical protein Chls_823 [Chlamydia suis]|uniref:Uncharacterized protein n=1 Tax=Chlamydia suis TaxID=83559 RepID=A0ABX6IR97_9CHLA|nr:hypothetical protein Chls_823 [Chlamydia suis]
MTYKENGLKKNFIESSVNRAPPKKKRVDFFNSLLDGTIE